MLFKDFIRRYRLDLSKLGLFGLTTSVVQSSGIGLVVRSPAGWQGTGTAQCGPGRAGKKPDGRLAARLGQEGQKLSPWYSKILYPGSVRSQMHQIREVQPVLWCLRHKCKLLNSKLLKKKVIKSTLKYQVWVPLFSQLTVPEILESPFYALEGERKEIAWFINRPCTAFLAGGS